MKTGERYLFKYHPNDTHNSVWDGYIREFSPSGNHVCIERLVHGKPGLSGHMWYTTEWAQKLIVERLS